MFLTSTLHVPYIHVCVWGGGGSLDIGLPKCVFKSANEMMRALNIKNSIRGSTVYVANHPGQMFPDLQAE